MRVLFSSTRGAGHFNPLVPFPRAFERAGHELLFAGPPDLAGPVDATGFEFWQFDPPPEDELGTIWARVPELPQEEANEVVVGEIFGRLNTTAALPRLRAACVLAESSYRERARSLADELRAQPPVDDAVLTLKRLG